MLEVNYEISNGRTQVSRIPKKPGVSHIARSQLTGWTGDRWELRSHWMPWWRCATFACFQNCLVVEPTHLKNLLVKLDHFPEDRDENKKYLSCHHPENHIKTLHDSLPPSAILRRKRLAIWTQLTPADSNHDRSTEKGHTNSPSPTLPMLKYHC